MHIDLSWYNCKRIFYHVLCEVLFTWHYYRNLFLLYTHYLALWLSPVILMTSNKENKLVFKELERIFEKLAKS